MNKVINQFRRRRPENYTVDSLFPGRWIGGLSMVLAPLCMLVGGVLKAPYNFYYPNQIQAFNETPTRINLGYELIALSFFLLWPALLLCTQLIVSERPLLGRVAGVLAILGLLTNVSHEAVNNVAYQMTDSFGTGQTTDFITKIYGLFSVPYMFTWADNVAWALLAVGLFTTCRLDWFRSLCIFVMALHYSGILKGFSFFTLALDVLLCIAFISFGYEIIRGRFTPAKNDPHTR